jgi:hypothetical protein
MADNRIVGGVDAVQAENDADGARLFQTRQQFGRQCGAV